MGASELVNEEVAAYVGSQAHEIVVHVEHAATEQVGQFRYDIWDVHCANSRWWVLSNPMNLYTQQDFKSRDVALTFHIGLMVRLSQRREVPVSADVAQLLPGSWRRWQQAVAALAAGDEAEDFQAVGVRLRECLVSFIGEAGEDYLVPDGMAPPKRADFKAWADLLANFLAQGSSAAEFRSYLKRTADGTWRYVNWLTHAKNAIRMDAEIGVKAVQHMLGIATAGWLRLAALTGPDGKHCDECGSYDVAAGVCRYCGWLDPHYQPPLPLPEWDEAERAKHLAEPCIPTSDISTYISPNDYT